MKQPQKALIQLLRDIPAVTNAVGTDIFPLQSPPGKKPPMILYGVNDVTPNATKDGASTVDSYEMQITILHPDYGTAVEMDNAIRKALDYRKDYTYEDIKLDLIYFIEDTEHFDKDLDQHGTYVKTQLYGIRTKN